MPGYTRADAAVYYSLTERMRLQANVENLFDRKYYINADSNTTHLAGLLARDPDRVDCGSEVRSFINSIPSPDCYSRRGLSLAFYRFCDELPAQTVLIDQQQAVA